MDRLARQLRSLRRWVFVLAGVIVLAGGWRVGRGILEAVDSSTRRPHCFWQGGAIRITASHWSPLVITHLRAGGAGSVVDHVAALNPPIACNGSDGAFVNRDRMAELKWTDQYGLPTQPPKEGEPISALYFVPSEAEFKAASP